MMTRTVRQPELWFTVALVTLTLAIAAGFGFGITLPARDAAAFVGIHYLYPLLGVAVWGVAAIIGQRAELARTFLVALPCYALVLLCHFNLKIWGPFINPALWDGLFWQSDLALRPLVDACMAIRQFIAPLVPLDSNLYMTGFIAMFYISFCYHALSGLRQFRTLFLAALTLQGLGALAYLAMPAVGPFLYESGVEPTQTSVQASMLAVRQDLLTHGSGWLDVHGGTHFTAGLAAMPSLHTGGSFLFLLFAWRYAPILVPGYAALFGFIAIDAVASRWHYLVDLPIGMLLAWCCASLAERLNPADATGEQAALSDNIKVSNLFTHSGQAAFTLWRRIVPDRQVERPGANR